MSTSDLASRATLNEGLGLAVDMASSAPGDEIDLQIAVPWLGMARGLEWKYIWAMILDLVWHHMEVSLNKGIPEWMVYNTFQIWWFRGNPFLGNHHIYEFLDKKFLDVHDP